MRECLRPPRCSGRRALLGRMKESQPKSEDVPGRPVSFSRWFLPPALFVKVNCDASFSSPEDYAGYGWLARDSWGTLLHAEGMAHSPLLAEALALKQAGHLLGL